MLAFYEYYLKQLYSLILPLSCRTTQFQLFSCFYSKTMLQVLESAHYDQVLEICQDFLQEETNIN
jgi:hypothetical protein